MEGNILQIMHKDKNWPLRLTGVFSQKLPKFLGNYAYNIPTTRNLLKTHAFLCLAPHTQKESKSHHWFKSYGDFAEWVEG